MDHLLLLDGDNDLDLFLEFFEMYQELSALLDKLIDGVIVLLDLDLCSHL